MKKNRTEKTLETTIGLDLGDKNHYYHMIDQECVVIKKGKIGANVRAVRRFFSAQPPSLIAMEAGTHSPWISREAHQHGHRVLVGNPRKLRMIYRNEQKSDERDAEMLARIARMDPQLLYPIVHRGPRAQSHLAVLKSRDVLVGARTKLINHCRGIVKSSGERLPTCSAASFARHRDEIPEDLAPALQPVFEMIGELTKRIKNMDYTIKKLCEKEYPETGDLQAIKGVGPITSLAFVLTLEQPERFAKSRAVPVYLGLTPKRDQSGDSDKQLRITKAGDMFLRRLLVQCAQYILGPLCEDSDLRRWGLKLCARGGKNAKKRATVAVARKLAVLLHRLWSGKQPYDPFYHSKQHDDENKAKQAA